MKIKNGIQLLHTYLYGKADPEQKARVEKWYESLDDSAEMNEDLAAVKQQLYERTRAELDADSKVVPFYKTAFFRATAAAILVMCMGGMYLLIKSTGTNNTTVEVAPQILQDIAAPAGNKAVLTLADGTTIILDSTATGAFATQGNATVAKLNDGKIAYNAAGTTKPAVVQYNKLSVPRGSRPMQLLLADGTQVWLNVASYITYPTTFTGTERKVEITGEAYFEVAHNKSMPFIVKRNEMEVLVLGTHFNVNTYDDEELFRVTLLEGAVNVSDGSTEPKAIKPGQQATLKPGHVKSIKVLNNIDMDEVMAWKNGWFNFNSLQVTDIMRQIEKWYDVDVHYQGKPGDKHFTGIVSRDNNVSEVLKIMESAGIRFKIEKKNITVLAKQE
ncbi:FecR family protein [Lacibacter luteus]|uniref:FecR family protein n=1 Tax=Lacibacter luteus TaxID=2508719 RepID=A0A4Q1CL31_9BACT|nr:FecR family protein [Lacibacter luteus]RXK61697.1 FecR family protein [Lacibacter luteus]